MKNLLFRGIGAVLALSLWTTGASALVIDDFSAPTSALSTSSPFTLQDSITVGPGIAGGDRGFGLIQRSHSGSQTADVSGGSLNFDGSLLTGGFPTDPSGINLIYDGNPASGGFGIGNTLGADLTDGGGSTAFRFAAMLTDTDIELTIDVRNGSNISQIAIVVPSDPAPQDVVIDFSSFTVVGGSGADFTVAESVAFFLRAPTAGTFGIDAIETISTAETQIPAPGGMLLFGLGLAALAIRRRFA
jgi:MYXO-CTERM domain-containing protein